jgi:peptidoglycan/LPS O-acetylase OafA/YrhL
MAGDRDQQLSIIPGWLRPFSRSTSSGFYLPEVDGLRCLAIAAVMAFHLAGYVMEKAPRPYPPLQTFDLHFYQLLRTGHIGVQLFFIISGFVVAMPFAKYQSHRRANLAIGTGGKQAVNGPVNLRQYFLRRLTRIEPPYFIALVFWLFAFGLSGLGQATFRGLLPHFAASCLYIHNLIYREPSWVMPPAWSLEIEIQFYVIAPLLAMVFRIRSRFHRRGLLIAVMATLALAQHWLRSDGQINGLHLLQELHYFLLGFLLLDIQIESPVTLPEALLFHDLLASAALVGLILLLMVNPIQQLGITFLLGCFVIGCLRGRLWRKLLQVPILFTFGGMCYTTYLYHGFFKALPGHFSIRLQITGMFWVNFLIQSAILIPIIVIGSATLFLITEKPFMHGRGRSKFLAAARRAELGPAGRR